MCTICGSSNCASNRGNEKTVFVYGEYKKHSNQREYLGTVIVNTWDKDRTIRMKIFDKYPDWQAYTTR